MSSLKRMEAQIVLRFPLAAEVLRSLRRKVAERESKRIFSTIYSQNTWGDSETRSGSGSNAEQTRVIRSVLPSIIEETKAQSVLDAGCGDFSWMRDVIAPEVTYTGVELVSELVASNQQRYGCEKRIFLEADITKDRLPAVDLVICRDCLVHLSCAQILSAIRNFKQCGAKYLLATTFPSRQENGDITPGGWRPINLQLSPFHFPEPSELINEGCTEDDGKWQDKSLGLWRLDEV